MGTKGAAKITQEELVAYRRWFKEERKKDPKLSKMEIFRRIQFYAKNNNLPVRTEKSISQIFTRHKLADPKILMQGEEEEKGKEKQESILPDPELPLLVGERVAQGLALVETKFREILKANEALRKTNAKLEKDNEDLSRRLKEASITIQAFAEKGFNSFVDTQIHKHPTEGE